LSNGRQEYERLAEKNDELVEKVEVVNSQIVRMTNEHE
jgi:chromosome segregation ATPase